MQKKCQITKTDYLHFVKFFCSNLAVPN